MKHIRSFKIFESSKDHNIQVTRIRKEVMSIADNTDVDGDGAVWTNAFIEELKKANFEVFVDPGDEFEPQELDVILSPEDYPGDDFYMFEDGTVQGIGQEFTWEEFKEEFKDYEKPAIIIARKK